MSIDKKHSLMILNSEKIQNKIIESMPPFPELSFEKERLSWGNVDEWPNGKGEFGKSAENPIPVNRTWGEIAYLSRLRWNGEPVFFHRLGSVIGGIDIFALVSQDGTHYDNLFFDMYHKYRSRKAPKGYTLFEGELDGLTGSAEYITNFPRNLKNALADTSKLKFGNVIISNAIKNFNEDVAVETISKSRQSD